MKILTVDEIRALGRNSPADDHAFAAVARLSEFNLAAYRKMLQPLVKALVSQKMADAAHAMNPLRLSYTIFADSNPWMKGVHGLAESAAASRRTVAAGNPFVALQTKTSSQIFAALNRYQATRDRMVEKMFFAIYGSPVLSPALQAMLGIAQRTRVRPPPTTSPEQLTARENRSQAYAAKLTAGGYDAALIRAVM